jgi:hypothetical protein
MQTFNFSDYLTLIALKTADQLLKKNPNHGDTEAMKALTLNATGQADDGILDSFPCNTRIVLM